MPVVVVKGVEALLVLVFGFSIFSWLLPGGNQKIPVGIELKTFQNDAYYGTIEINDHKEFLIIAEDKDAKNGKPNGKVKITFRRKGQDINLIYERDTGQEIGDVDRVVIEKILEEMDKVGTDNNKASVVQERIKGVFKSILNQPSKGKKRGMVSKFLP